MLMKSFLLLAALFLTATAIQAQVTRFEARESPCKIEFVTDPQVFEHVCYNKIESRSTRRLQILWERVDFEITEGWEAYVCDNLNCYPSFITRCPEENYNDLYPDSTVNMDVHIADMGKEGSAHIIVYVFETTDTVNKLKVDYLFNKSLSTNGVRKTQLIRMYPNPAQNSFNVEYNYGVSRIELYNLMGKKVGGFQAQGSRSYDISHLDDGIYLVRLIGNDQQVIKTLKLHKRADRP